MLLLTCRPPGWCNKWEKLFPWAFVVTGRKNEVSIKYLRRNYRGASIRRHLTADRQGTKTPPGIAR